MNDLLGANPEQLRLLARQMGESADRIASAAAAIHGVVENSPWQGPDAISFRGTWTTTHRTSLLSCGELLRDNSQLLLTQADDQERASSSDTAGSGGSSDGPGDADNPVVNAGNKEDIPGNPDTSEDHEPIDTPISENPEDLQPEDIDQGALADCWLLAGLGAVAGQDPEFIAEHMTLNEDGTYTVRFYDDGEPVDITVDPTRVPAYAGDPNGQPNFATIYEKAAAEFFGGSYSDIEYDDPQRALEAITGQSSQTEGGLSFDQIEDRMGGGPVVASSAPGDQGFFDLWPDEVEHDQIVTNHVYIVEGIEERNGERMIHLRNPWGPDGGTGSDGEQKVGDIWLTEEEYRENFPSVSSIE